MCKEEDVSISQNPCVIGMILRCVCVVVRILHTRNASKHTVKHCSGSLTLWEGFEDSRHPFIFFYESVSVPCLLLGLSQLPSIKVCECQNFTFPYLDCVEIVRTVGFSVCATSALFLASVSHFSYSEIQSFIHFYSWVSEYHSSSFLKDDDFQLSEHGQNWAACEKDFFYALTYKHIIEHHRTSKPH